MNNYTTKNNSYINSQIDNYLHIIIAELLNIIPENLIKSIALTGSFGREEGGVILHEKKVIPVNDFDITIFPKKNINFFKSKYSHKLESLSQSLLKEIPIKQIDFGIGDIRKFFLRAAPPFFTVNAYEFIFGYKVLYGNLSLTNLRFLYKARKIPISEGVKYLYTRGSGLLIPFLDFFQKSNLINDFYKYIELNKACLAIGDSILIRNKKYHYSYKKRLETVNNISFKEIPNGDELKKIYLQALKWKINPCENLNLNIETELHRVAKIFLNYALWYESFRLKTNINSLEDYINIKLNERSFLRSNIYDLSHPLFLIGSYLNNHNLNSSIGSLLFTNIFENQPSLEELTKSYLKKFHPGGIVKNLLEYEKR